MIVQTECSFIIEARGGGGGMEQLIALDKCMTLSLATFFLQKTKSHFDFYRKDRDIKITVYGYFLSWFMCMWCSRKRVLMG